MMVFLLIPFVHILLLCFHADSCICTTYFREVVVPSKAHACNKGPHSYSDQRVGSPVSIFYNCSHFFVWIIFFVKIFKIFSCARRASGP